MAAVILGACGGGASGPADQAPVSNPPPLPPPVFTPSANPSANVLQQGLYSYSGFGLIINGVRQSYISKSTLNDMGRMNSEIVATFATSLSTQPSIFDGFNGSYLYADGTTAPSVDTRIAFDESSDFVTWKDPLLPTVVGWKVTLLATDISGQPVASQIKRSDGSPIEEASLGLANPTQVFAPGSKAYLASFEAAMDMTLSGSRMLRVVTEDDLIGAGWCIPVTGKADRLGVILGADGKLLLYAVPEGLCSINGLTPIETGSWTKEATAPNVVYHLNYPESFKTGPWGGAFSGAYSPKFLPPNRVFRDGLVSNLFYSGHFVPKGTVLQSRQPFFNHAALPSLRAASGL